VALVNHRRGSDADCVMAPYERFGAWRACHDLALQVYRITARFPASERYGLVSQARRAAFSAAANIVEGSSKREHREFRRFLDIAFGSLTELGYTLRFAKELGLLEPQDAADLEARHTDASRLTWKLYASMNQNHSNHRTA